MESNIKLHVEICKLLIQNCDRLWSDTYKTNICFYIRTLSEAWNVPRYLSDWILFYVLFPQSRNMWIGRGPKVEEGARCPLYIYARPTTETVSLSSDCIRLFYQLWITTKHGLRSICGTYLMEQHLLVNFAINYGKSSSGTKFGRKAVKKMFFCLFQFILLAVLLTVANSAPYPGGLGGGGGGGQ